MNAETALRSWSPWSPADGLRWAVIAVIGHALAVVSWWVASRQAELNDQVGWATLAVAAFAIVGYADISWLLQARFSIIQRREAMLPTLELVAETGATMTAVDHHPDAVVGGPGLARFHRPSCPLATAKAWPVLDRDRAVDEGRRACGVCSP